MSIDNETEAVRQGSLSRQSHPLWRNRDYVLLWSGQAISSIGTGVSQFALPLFILIVTKSPALAGFIAAMRALPYFVFTLPAGALVDRWDRKLVMKTPFRQEREKQITSSLGKEIADGLRWLWRHPVYFW